MLKSLPSYPLGLYALELMQTDQITYPNYLRFSNSKLTEFLIDRIFKFNLG